MLMMELRQMLSTVKEEGEDDSDRKPKQVKEIEPEGIEAVTEGSSEHKSVKVEVLNLLQTK